MAVSRPSEHWQFDKTLIECNRHMLLNEDFSDVTFILDYKDATEKKEPVHIPAHQTLLLARSPVFAAMFTGDMAEKTDRPVIHIDDVEPQGFKEMLRFMYTDEVQLNADDVMQVMYGANKYIITNLSKKCSQFLQENVSTDTAPHVLEQSILYDEKDLKAKVLTKIAEEAPAVLSSEDFTTLSGEALHEVLQLNLKISNEIDVFNASVKCAANRCQQLKRTIDGENIREVLGDNLFLIRFPAMTIDDINDIVIPQDILTDQEALQVRHFLTAKSKPENLPFPIEPRIDRTPRALLIPAPYEEQVKDMSPKNSWIKSTNLNCTVSRSVQIRKIYMHAFSHHPWFKQNLFLALTQNRETLLSYVGEQAIIPESDGTPCHFAVEANDACVKAGALQVDIQLTISNTHRRRSRSYGIQFSSQAATKLSDSVVSIEFPPVNENLLLGFEYSLM